MATLSSLTVFLYKKISYKNPFLKLIITLDVKFEINVFYISEAPISHSMTF